MPRAQPTEAVVQACRLLRSEQPMATRAVARALGLSDSYFQRCFKKHLGITPQQYRRRVLAERARDSISDASSVTESIYASGYSASSRFYDGVGRELGMQPSVARAGGLGEQIKYFIGRCSLGGVLIAWTSRGVCEVAFADSKSDLLAVLQKHFPKAVLEASRETRWARAIIDSVEMSEPADVPLDIRGTAFQERVWCQLRSIPAGQTRTYTEIAEAVGEPAAARAVARACASNKLAVLVPCHRVVRKDGSPAGYRWGVDRKLELLRREAELEKP